MNHLVDANKKVAALFVNESGIDMARKLKREYEINALMQDAWEKSCWLA